MSRPAKFARVVVAATPAVAVAFAPGPAPAADANSGRIENVFDVSGAGDFSGLSHGEYRPRIGTSRHQFGFGIEDRDFTNDVNFLGQPIGSNVRRAAPSICATTTNGAARSSPAS